MAARHAYTAYLKVAELARTRRRGEFAMGETIREWPLGLTNGRS